MMNWSRLLSLVPGGLKRQPAVGKATEMTPALAERWTLAVYSSGAWMHNSWLGFPILQLPNDLMIMQELIVRTRPSVIVETGTFHGGSAIFYASVLSQLGAGRVISIEAELNDDVRRRILEHPLGERIVLIVGDSVHPETVERVSVALHDEEPVLVALDSGHAYDHVLAELRAYHGFVPVGGYLVAFDTIVGAINALPDEDGDPADSPKQAVQAFLKEHPEFEVDTSCDRLPESFCHGGFLKRIG